jgi:hypothetical protein
MISMDRQRGADILQELRPTSCAAHLPIRSTGQAIPRNGSALGGAHWFILRNRASQFHYGQVNRK